MTTAIENIALFSADDTAVLLSCFTESYGAVSPSSLIAFYSTQTPVLYNGNGLFSDVDDSVLLLTDGIFNATTGGKSDPEPTSFKAYWIPRQSQIIGGGIN
jgi:hypothetical protein